jgi:subtilisin family serine protease
MTLPTRSGLQISALLLIAFVLAACGTRQSPAELPTLAPTFPPPTILAPADNAAPPTIPDPTDVPVVDIQPTETLIPLAPAPSATLTVPAPTLIPPTPANVESLREDILVQPATERIIQFTANTTVTERQTVLTALGAEVQTEIDGLNAVVVVLPSDATLSDTASVQVTEPDYFVTTQVTTSDEFVAQQWALDAIGAEAMWATGPETAGPSIVAVIDSGICADHPDLAGRILPGYDFVEGDTIPQDEIGHGCGVAGIIAANVDNGIGIAGVSTTAQIMPLRVLDGNGIGRYSDVAAAIVYATDNGASIINLSLGGLYPSNLLQDAIIYATERGVTVVAAAGNTGDDRELYPAAYGPVISVGAVQQDLSRAPFSSNSPPLMYGRRVRTF